MPWQHRLLPCSRHATVSSRLRLPWQHHLMLSRVVFPAHRGVFTAPHAVEAPYNAEPCRVHGTKCGIVFTATLNHLNTSDR